MISTKSFFSCMVLLAMLPTSQSLTCYSCTPGTDDCGSNFNPKGSGVTQVTPTGVSAGCAKDVFTSNPNSIGRAAFLNCVTSSSIIPSTSIADEITRYCCTTDFCNGSRKKTASLSVLMALVLLYLLS